MKKVIIVDVSTNSKSKERSMRLIINNLIKECGSNYDLYCFDTFAYQLYDLDDLIDSDFEYDRPCAYYDCLMEIMRQYAGRNIEKASFYIISEHIDDCSRLADKEIFERYIQHIRSNYGAIIYSPDSNDTNDDYCPGLIKSFLYRLKCKISYPEDFEEEYEDAIIDEPDYLRTKQTFTTAHTYS